MMNKWQVHHMDRDWTILSFPERNRSIVWDDTNKTYNFYEGVARRQKRIKTPSQIKKPYQDEIDRWRRTCFWLAGGLGICLIAIAIAYYL